MFGLCLIRFTSVCCVLFVCFVCRFECVCFLIMLCDWFAYLVLSIVRLCVFVCVNVLCMCFVVVCYCVCWCCC